MDAVLRADHIGFLRPPELLETVAEVEQGRRDPATLTELEERAILQVLDLQREAGIGIFTDGEDRRRWYSGAWDDSIAGLVRTEEGELSAPGMWQGHHDALAEATASEVAPSYVGASIRLWATNPVGPSLASRTMARILVRSPGRPPLPPRPAGRTLGPRAGAGGGGAAGRADRRRRPPVPRRRRDPPAAPITIGQVIIDEAAWTKSRSRTSRSRSRSR